jgi:hypothetical protein
VERHRPLDETTIDAICAQLGAAVPELARDGISIFDQAGRTYLAPGHSAAVSRTRSEAFASQTERRILQQLRWIEGLRVLVTTEASPGAEGQAPSIALNQAVEPGRGSAIEETTGGWRSRVIIQVPTSYYMRGYRTFVSDREPTEAELEPYIELTEGRIRHIVEGIVPAPELESLVIERMDEVGAEARVAVSMPPARGLSIRWPAWTPVAVSWAVIALAMLGVLTRAGVRIATQGTKGDTGSVVAKPPRMAESLERVNRLVRERPEVAAAILERWALKGVVSS